MCAQTCGSSPAAVALQGKRVMTFHTQSAPSAKQWAQHMATLLKEINKVTHEAGAIASEVYRSRYRALLEEADREYPAPDESTRKGNRGKLARSNSENLLERLRDFEGKMPEFMLS